MHRDELDTARREALEQARRACDADAREVRSCCQMHVIDPDSNDSCRPLYPSEIQLIRELASRAVPAGGAVEALARGYLALALEEP